MQKAKNQNWPKLFKSCDFGALEEAPKRSNYNEFN